MAEKSGYMKDVADYVDDGSSESEAMQKALLDMGIDMGWDFVGGLISGGIMGGGGKVATTSAQQLQNYKTGKNIQSTNGGVDALLNSANEVRSMSSADIQNKLTSQIDKVNQKPTARNVGKLYQTVQQANAVANQVNIAGNQTNASVNQADVANRLISKGVNSKKADGIAEVVVARLNGQELTRTQRNRLRSALDSPTVLNVISDITKKKSDGIDSTQKRGYDNNISDGLTDEEKTALWDLAYQRVGGDRSGGPGTLREIGSIPSEAFSSAQLRGLTSEVDVFGDNDYATVMEGSSPDQVRKAFSKRNYESGTDAFKFNNWDDMKDAYEGNITQFIKENKPKYSPDIKKWFDNGGSIEVQDIDGKQIWTYTSSAGVSVPYIDGYIKFPDEYLHPTIKSVDIGEFTGDRGKDIDKMLPILQADYGIDKIPDGYTVHHDIVNGILQLVDESIHTEFTHIGGYSIYK